MQKKRETHNISVFNEIRSMEIKYRKKIVEVVSNVIPNGEAEEFTKVGILFAAGLFSESFIQETHYTGGKEFPQLHNEAYFFIAKQQSPTMYVLLKNIETMYLNEKEVLYSTYIGAKKRILK